MTWNEFIHSAAGLEAITACKLLFLVCISGGLVVWASESKKQMRAILLTALVMGFALVLALPDTLAR